MTSSACAYGCACTSEKCAFVKAFATDFLRAFRALDGIIKRVEKEKEAFEQERISAQKAREAAEREREEKKARAEHERKEREQRAREASEQNCMTEHDLIDLIA